VVYHELIFKFESLCRHRAGRERGRLAHIAQSMVNCLLFENVTMKL